MISLHRNKLTLVAGAPAERLHQILALIQLIITEANYKVVRLEVIAFDQAQRFLRAGAEFRHHAEPRRQCAQQRDRTFSSEVIEAQCGHRKTVAPTIRGK